MSTTTTVAALSTQSIAGNTTGYPLSGFMTVLASTSFIVLGTIGVFLYVLILVAIARNRQKFRSPYYIFLFTLGVGEILDLIFQGPFDGFCILRAYALDSPTCAIPQWIDRTIGWIQTIDFIVEYPLDLLIAFDRIVAVVFFVHRANIFTRRRVGIMCVAGWLYAFAIAAPIMVWNMPVSFIILEFTQGFEIFDPNVALWNQINSALGGALITCSFCFYMVTIGSLVARSLKKKVKPIRNAGATEPNMKPEVKLLIQSILRFSLIIIVVVYGNIQQNFTPLIYYSFGLLTLAVPLCTTVVTICLNGDIREEVGRMLRHKNTTPVSSVTPGVGEHHQHAGAIGVSEL